MRYAQCIQSVILVYRTRQHFHMLISTSERMLIVLSNENEFLNSKVIHTHTHTHMIYELVGNDPVFLTTWSVLLTEVSNMLYNVFCETFKVLFVAIYGRFLVDISCHLRLLM